MGLFVTMFLSPTYKFLDVLLQIARTGPVAHYPRQSGRFPGFLYFFQSQVIIAAGDITPCQVHHRLCGRQMIIDIDRDLLRSEEQDNGVLKVSSLGSVALDNIEASP